MEPNASEKEIFHLIRNKKSPYWKKIRSEKTLSLFHSAAQRVPAYKDFLKKNNISPSKIKTWEDFQHVPPVDKKNYLRQYPLPMLCWDGSLQKPFVYTATSGSTGIPFYFMRENRLDWQYSLIAQEFLENGENNRHGAILGIDCFGMGVWIGGLFSYKAFEIASLRTAYPLSLITPGVNKKEILNILKLLAPNYENILLMGYPPFVKDIIDSARDEGVDLKKYNLRILFAAEAITEEFRDYMQKFGGVKNVYKDTMNIYGSADIGAMAIENPTSILIKRLAYKKKKFFVDIFSPLDKTPTLAQYNPYFINFEAPQGEILLSGDSALPLIRYSIGDHGGVVDFDEMDEKLKGHGINLEKEAKIVKVDQLSSELPFVFVYERIDLSTTYYGIWIYPEWFRKVFLIGPLNKYVSGKFTLETKYDKKQNQFLEINVEMKRHVNVSKKLENMIQSAIVESLQSHSSEYRELSDKLGRSVWPKITLWNSEDPLYFQPGIKQKWVKKT